MRALLAEQEISRLKVGLPAEVTPVGQDRSVAGSIWLLSPTVNPQTRQGEARIAINPDANIRPGGFASARIMSRPNAPTLVPAEPQSRVQGQRHATRIDLRCSRHHNKKKPKTTTHK